MVFSVDRKQGIAHLDHVNKINTMSKQNKLSKITEAVYNFPKAGLSKFQAAEVAANLLAKHNWVYEQAVKDAAAPYIVSGRPVWP
jgi:hypothetical protein